MDLQEAKNIFDQANQAYVEEKYEVAEKLLLKIDNHSDELKELYAEAQIKLGFIYWRQSKVELEIESYKKVPIEIINQYAKAQYLLGLTHRMQDEPNLAIESFNRVPREILKEYAEAQIFLALTYRDQHEYDLAVEAFNRVPTEIKQEYAKAQYSLALMYSQQDKINLAIEALNKVSIEIKDQYAKSQYFLGLMHGRKKEIELERDAYQRVPIDIEEEYGKAQFMLGVLENSCIEKYKFWKNIPKNTETYTQERYQINIVERIVSLENNNSKNQLYKIFKKISDILKNLFVNNEYEQYIAHYTNLTVSKLLLAIETDNKKVNEKEDQKIDFKLKSALRLNTINLMNDPEEGLLISQLLCLDKKITTQDSAFITCFTLHHDSLNQFRLYAKEAQQEALGLSLVLGKEFFAKEHNAARIYEKSKLERVEGLDKNIDAEETNKKNALAVMPLYRCIYFDPTSGLVKVAQREEWSFRREFKLENKHQWFDENPSAEEKWQEYNQKVTEIEKNVKLGLKELSALVEKLRIDQLNEQEKEVLAEIFLPLRYLIKNMAFKEEQECRIVYVTQMDNPLIQYDEKINRIYIDYAPSVMEHLEKIYIAPKAKDEKMVFEYFCSRGQEIRKGKEAVKVKISQNPFR